MQPILVKSARPSKKQFKKIAESDGYSEKEFKEFWENNKKKWSSPRHIQLYRFNSFPSCAYVYYDSPNWIEHRKIYWDYLEFIFEVGELNCIPKDQQQKILDEIESLLPKPYGPLLEILERAYEAGMPKKVSLYEAIRNNKM
jgi:hypothetical protein